MAKSLFQLFAIGRIGAPSGTYPGGSIKNETVPDNSNDGTPLDFTWGNQIEGFLQAIFKQNDGESANDITENADLSQYLNALAHRVSQIPFCLDTGVVNAYVLNTVYAPANPSVYVHGHRYEVEITTANTLASTAKIGAGPVKPVKTVTGANVPAGYIGFGRQTLTWDNVNDWWVASREDEIVGLFTRFANGRVRGRGSDTFNIVASAVGGVSITFPLSLASANFSLVGALDGIIGTSHFINYSIDSKTTVGCTANFIASDGIGDTGNADFEWVFEGDWY